MKNKELYQKTTDILFNAYFNDTLAHGSCSACAVGNIICSNMSFNLIKYDFGSFDWKDKKGDIVHQSWINIFFTVDEKQDVYPDRYERNAKIQIDSTGYTWQQMARVEFAFETASCGSSGDEWMFNGLCAVIDVLNEIHEVDQDKQKPRFESHYKTLCNAR